jgi:hypothetical protein
MSKKLFKCPICQSILTTNQSMNKHMADPPMKCQVIIDRARRATKDDKKRSRDDDHDHDSLSEDSEYEAINEYEFNEVKPRKIARKPRVIALTDDGNVQLRYCCIALFGTSLYILFIQILMHLDPREREPMHWPKELMM